MPTYPSQDETALMSLVVELRNFLRDHPSLNRLVRGEETSDRFLVWAINDALCDWNGSPPLIAPTTVRNHPRRDLLLRRAAAAVLESVGLLQTRNHLSYSDGSGAMVNASDKGPMLQGWVQYLLSRYAPERAATKIALNIEGGWGEGVHSDLYAIHGSRFYEG